jgi:hypothetical protein
VATSAGGEAASGRENEGDDASWAAANLTGSKIKKIYAVDSGDTNGWWKFKIMMS